MTLHADIFDYVLCEKRLEILRAKLRDVDSEHFEPAYELIGLNEVVDHEAFVQTVRNVTRLCDD